MALALFRFLASLGRTMVVANTLGIFTLLMVFILGGYIVSKDDIQSWMIWGYYVSPMMYGQNAIAINEFLDDRWNIKVNDPVTGQPTVGKALLKSIGLFVDNYWYWICIGALLGYSLLFNACFIAAMTYLKPLGDSKSTIVDEDGEEVSRKKSSAIREQRSMITEISSSSVPTSEGVREVPENSGAGHASKRGMVLPFEPLSLAFNHVNYYVDMPAFCI